MTLWGESVVASDYAGHEGRVFEPRPTSLVQLLDDSARFGTREFPAGATESRGPIRRHASEQ